MKLLNIVSSLHNQTKRDHLARMIDDKVNCMIEAKKYEKNYWDGPRKFGYGGYKYIPNRWKNTAKKIIKKYKLNNKSKILDIYGIDISKHALKNAPKVLKKNLKILKAQDKYPFKNKFFDLCISLACLHNLEIFDLEIAIKEINRVSKKKYIMVESYKNEQELFNLQCWALTCESFFSKKEWIWLLNKFGYDGDLELIYF